MPTGFSSVTVFLLAVESAVRWLAENDTDAFRQLASQFEIFRIRHYPSPAGPRV